MDQEMMQWIKTAEIDYSVAQHLFQTFYPKPYEIVCYHCQQAAEKAIKALIIKTGAQGGLPKKHDLSFLLSQIKNMFEIDEKFFDYADTLTPYGISIRYPNELYLDERHAAEALKMTKEILEWIKSLVKDAASE